MLLQFCDYVFWPSNNCSVYDFAAKIVYIALCLAYISLKKNIISLKWL